MTQDKELLPCRCGNDDVIPVGVTGHKFTHISYYEVGCGECGFFVRLPTHDEIVDAWNKINTRPSPVVSGENEKLLEAIDFVENYELDKYLHDPESWKFHKNLDRVCEAALQNQPQGNEARYREALEKIIAETLWAVDSVEKSWAVSRHIDIHNIAKQALNIGD